MSEAKPTQLTPAQQQAAVDRIHENLALRSGAGCGKTYVLARRFTELLMSNPDPAVALSRLVALTFTDKAAMEMTQRVRKMISDFAAGAGSPADRRRLLEHLEQVSEARISTIHGFCAALLRTHAIEAGVDPDFAVCADELLAQRMIAEAADQALLTAVESRDQAASDLLTRFSYNQAVDLLQDLVNNRTSVQLDSYLDPAATLARWAGLLELQRRRLWENIEKDAEFQADLAELEQSSFADKSGKLTAIRNEFAALAGAVLRDAGERTRENLQRIADIRPGVAGGTGPDATQCRASIKRVQARIVEIADQAGEINPLDEQSAAAVATLTRLAAAANDIYRRRKVQAGLLDFNDLLDRTAALLKSNPALRAQLAGQIDQLLIDECQDTDPFQLGMLCLLVGAATESLPGEGRLFIVGDAKQSIYRFRGAQVEVFEELCKRFGPSRQQQLDVSFRTHRAGMAFVNTVFGKLISDYQPTRSNRTVQPPGPSVEVLLAAGEQGFADAQEASDAQAALTARRIREMIDGGEKLVWNADANDWRAVRAGDVAILFSRMTNSLEYERQLAAANVPYYVVAGTGFFGQQEVLDLLNALRVIDNPDDDIALAGVLRSSLVGLDDNVLMHVARHCARPYFHALRQSLPPALDGPRTAALQAAMDLLADLHGRKDAMGIEAVLQTLLDATGYEAVLLASPYGKRMLGNVRLLLEQARAATAGALSLAEFIAQMDELVINESRYEQAAVAGEREDVVRLMTIHKAKGLEFPVVFVPDLNAGRRGLRGALLNRADWGLTLKLKPAGNSDDDAQDDDEDDAALPSSFRAAKALEDDDQAREDIRKYYVAATRHEDHLVLVGADWRTKDGQFHSAGGFLRSLAEVLDLSTAQVLTLRERSSDGQEYVCQVDVRYVHSAEASETTTERSARGGSATGGSATGRSAAPGAAMLKSAADAGQLAGNVAAAIAGLPLPELVGPLTATPANLRVAVTALCDFERCPMFFHWRYDLGVPERFLRGTGILSVSAPSQQQDMGKMPMLQQDMGKMPMLQKDMGKMPMLQKDMGKMPMLQKDMGKMPMLQQDMGKMPMLQKDTGKMPVLHTLDAAMAGTIFHRCMELTDFSAEAALGGAQSLVQRVLAEMGMDEQVDASALAADLQGMLAKFQSHELWAKLRAAKRIDRELAFETQAPGLVLRGQIDLLYQDEADAWHIVDYKSNRTGPEGVAPHALQYELQMLVYAMAARGHVGAPPAEATLYFLRAGASLTFQITPDSLDQALQRISKLAGELAHARRGGTFARRQCDACQYCPYGELCQK
jgi:ATP-dependent helicase/nuclease subunit A